MTFNLWSYRHISINFAREILKPNMDAFSTLHKPGWTGLDVVMANQAGHLLSTEQANYALNEAYPTKVRPELLRQCHFSWKMWCRFALERQWVVGVPDSVPVGIIER